MNRVSIFRAGKHTSAAGASLQFGESELAATIAAYDPAKHEAPIVVGHPKDNGPAYGWVKGLDFADGEMFADLAQVDPEFTEMVAAGRFKKRSASFYSPDSPSNPVPGVYYLRHVGFLGAQPPAVKGLKEVSFGDAEEGVVEFSEDAVVLSILARVLRGMRDTLLAKWGQEETDKALPGYLLEDLEAEARRAREEQAGAMPAFTETKTEEPKMDPKEIETLKAQAAKAAELERQVAEFSEREAKAARTAKVAEFKAELAPLVTAGKLLPAMVDGVAEFMAQLPDAEGVAEFGEAEAGKARTPLAFFRHMLASAPKAVDFTERAPGAAGANTGGDNVRDTAQRAAAYRAKLEGEGRTISFTEAFDAVERGEDLNK